MSGLLALDLDGTLLRRDGSVHPDDSAAIRRLLSAGVPVAIVTGRLYAGAREVIEELGLHGVHICANGAHLVEAPAERVVTANLLTPEVSAQVLHALRDPSLLLCVMVGDEVFLDPASLPMDAFVRTWTPVVSHVDAVRELPHWQAGGIAIVVAVGPRDTVLQVEAELLQAATHCLGFDLRHADGQRGLLVHAAGVSKGNALRQLAQHHLLTVDDVVAVGDWLNDISLFEAAGTAFAMGGAPDELQALATATLDARAGHGGGVAEAIARVWGL